jgi:hypothetical protein
VLRTALPAVLVGAFVLAGAVLHGAVTQRFSTARESGRADRTHAVVVAYADCEAKLIEHDVPLKEQSIATSRSYVSATLSFGASTSIISGVPGAVATHTPDVCYQASGYTMVRGPKRQSMPLADGRMAHYYVADFRKEKNSQVELLRIRWAWSADGNWSAPDRARFHYLRVSELYKLYVVTLLNPEAESSEDSPQALAFLAAAFEQYGRSIAP